MQYVFEAVVFGILIAVGWLILTLILGLLWFVMRVGARCQWCSTRGEKIQRQCPDLRNAIRA